MFCGPLWLWALWAANWRQRLASVGLAAAVVIAWAVPMIQLSGGWDVYRQALADYLKVWSPQSAYVVGDFASGGDTQASYNLNFLINYLRQMLGIGLVLVLYLLGRRFGPARLAADYRSRCSSGWCRHFGYVFAHLGIGLCARWRPAAILVALAFDPATTCGGPGGSRTRAGWLRRRQPLARRSGGRSGGGHGLERAGVCARRRPGPLARPARPRRDHLSASRVPAPASTGHDPRPGARHPAPTGLLPAGTAGRPAVQRVRPRFSDSARAHRSATGTEQVVVLDGPLKVDGGSAREVVLSEQPRVSVYVIDAWRARTGARLPVRTRRVAASRQACDSRRRSFLDRAKDTLLAIVELREYWAIVRRRWWVVAIVTAVALRRLGGVGLRGATAYRTDMRIAISTLPSATRPASCTSIRRITRTSTPSTWPTT
jgi:hypothetical protein